MATQQARHLQLIHGDLDKVVTIGNVAIRFGPRQRPPFPVSAIVVEQDTAMVLDEEPVLYAPNESLQRLREEVERFREPEPGSIVTQRGQPKRLYAIVHDLNQEPTWREEWVSMALENLLRESDRQRLPDLALPLLGCRFGNLTPERFLEILCSALQNEPPCDPLKLWLVVPRHRTHSLLMTLRRCSASTE